jgi:membrane-associated phospholipid phosphatase
VLARENRRNVCIWLIAWIFLIALAFTVDRQVATHIAAHPPFHKGNAISTIVKWPGNFWFTLLIAVLLTPWAQVARRTAAQLILAGIIGGLIYSVVKWIAGRPRPVPNITPFAFHAFINGIPGLWNANDLGFPSGHACLSFATAMCLAMAFPRFRWLFFLVAAIVGCERIGENAHYVSDVIAGAGFGILSALLADGLLRKFSNSFTAGGGSPVIGRDEARVTVKDRASRLRL